MATDVPRRPGAFQRPGRIRNGVDFSLMYGAHDAFVRDLNRLVAAVTAGRAGRRAGGAEGLADLQAAASRAPYG